MVLEQSRFVRICVGGERPVKSQKNTIKVHKWEKYKNKRAKLKKIKIITEGRVVCFFSQFHLYYHPAAKSLKVVGVDGQWPIPSIFREKKYTR